MNTCIGTKERDQYKAEVESLQSSTTTAETRLQELRGQRTMTVASLTVAVVAALAAGVMDIV